MGFEAELEWEGERRRAGKDLSDGAEGGGREEVGLENRDDHGGDDIQFSDLVFRDVGEVGGQVEAAHDIHRYAEAEGADVDAGDLGDEEHWCGDKAPDGVWAWLVFVCDSVLGGEIVVR